jgi:hypothetical protein
MRKWSALAALLLALPMVAEERDTLGVQARLSLPGGNLPDATGSQAPGMGASLLAELHFEPEVCLRLLIGADSWRQKGSAGDRSVRAYHVGAEAIYFLQDDGGDFRKGPFLIGGLAGITWALGADTRDTGTPLRVIHAGFTAGFGYRFNRHMDAEVKVLSSKVDPDFTATATMVSFTYRF